MSNNLSLKSLLGVKSLEPESSEKLLNVKEINPLTTNAISQPTQWMPLVFTEEPKASLHQIPVETSIGSKSESSLDNKTHLLAKNQSENFEEIANPISQTLLFKMSRHSKPSHSSIQKSSAQSSSPLNIKSYALEIFNTAIPKTVLIEKNDKEKALSILELSLEEKKIKSRLPSEVENKLRKLIQSSLYTSRWWNYIPCNGFAKLFFAETHYIHFDDRASKNAISFFKITRILSSGFGTNKRAKYMTRLNKTE